MTNTDEKDREAAKEICLENHLVLYIGTFSEENPRPLNPPVPSLNGMKAVKEAIAYGRRTAPRDGGDREMLKEFYAFTRRIKGLIEFDVITEDEIVDQFLNPLKNKVYKETSNE